KLLSFQNEMILSLIMEFYLLGNNPNDEIDKNIPQLQESLLNPTIQYLLNFNQIDKNFIKCIAILFLNFIPSLKNFSKLLIQILPLFNLVCNLISADFEFKYILIICVLQFLHG